MLKYCVIVTFHNNKTNDNEFSGRGRKKDYTKSENYSKLNNLGRRVAKHMLQMSFNHTFNI